MAIPELQLESWSHVGASVGSKETYAVIKAALQDRQAPYAARGTSIFLQGSYGNDTNIWADSDVDVVISTSAVYHFNVSALSPVEKTIFDDQFVPATYLGSDFKNDVTAWLGSCFGDDAKVGNKVVEIAARSSRRKADVLIANDYRLYQTNGGRAPLRYETGIRFVTQSGEAIINYPRQHSANLTTRHQVLDGWLKPTIRIFKNMRNRMVDDGAIAKGLAPSYFVEGMLYNVPSGAFGTSYQNTVSSCLGWLWKATMSDLRCANGIHPLIGEASPTSWPSSAFAEFLRASIDFWNGW